MPLLSRSMQPVRLSLAGPEFLKGLGSRSTCQQRSSGRVLVALFSVPKH